MNKNGPFEKLNDHILYQFDEKLQLSNPLYRRVNI